MSKTLKETQPVNKVNTNHLDQHLFPKKKKWIGYQPIQVDRVKAAKTTRGEPSNKITFAVAQENIAALKVVAAQRELQVSFSKDGQTTLTRPADVEPQLLSEIMNDVKKLVQEFSNNPAASSLAAIK